MRVTPHSHSSTVTTHVLWCLLPLLLIASAVPALVWHGYWWALPLLTMMVLAPLLDWLTGWQDDGDWREQTFQPWHRFLLRWNTRLYALALMGLVSWTAFHVATLNVVQVTLALSALGIMGGIGFSAAHELLHSRERLDQLLQRLLTAFLFYPHYKLIHIRSHHIHAGTEHDENTAWQNESIYHYIARTIPGSMLRSWQLEVRRLRASGKPWWGNEMVWLALGQAALLGALGMSLGPQGLGFYAIWLAASHFVLESVNYLQHYGLMRSRGSEGYERTGPEHSWDTYHFFSSYLTFRVGHHSHHHLAVRPYYLLAVEPSAPKLPAGYFWAIPLTWLPPWWKAQAARIQAEVAR